MPPATLTHWLEGGERDGRQYEPVLRPEPLGINTITWGEMVEARYLRAYRTDLHVSMQRLRPFIAKLREEFGVPFPLAHFRPFIDANRRLLLELQTASDLPQDLWVVYEFATGQTVLNPLLADNFLARIDFAETGDQVAERIRPLGKNSPVVLDPRRSSAAATVCFHPAVVEWGQRAAWTERSHTTRWYEFVERATPAQLELFGFPPPGHPYWTPETLQGVAHRYAGLDLTPWRP